MTVRIRDLEPGDWEAVAAIKSGYITTSAANFNEYPVTAEDIAALAATVRRDRGHFLAAEADGTVIGFAAADRFRTLSANRLAELSIYLTPERIGHGVGTELLTELIRRLRADGFYAGLMAVITADNAGSLRFHRKMGFADAGIWRRAAWKFGRWHDAVVLECLL